MKIVVGNKTKNINKKEFEEIQNRFSNTKIDLGTGDGRYVYKKALENPHTLYSGIDPVEKQLRKYSRRAVRKKLNNVLFIIGSAENLPPELQNTADEVSIILPWGSLLDYVANCNENIVSEIKRLMRPNADLKIIFGYTAKEEPTETERLNLEKLNQEYIEKSLVPQYKEAGFIVLQTKKLNQRELQEIETSWSKKLSFGKKRPLFLLRFTLAGR